MSLYTQCLILSVLAAACISTVQINLCIWIVFICYYFTVKILAVPPETTAHANCALEKLWSFVHCVTTDQTSKTGSSNVVTILIQESSRKPFLTDNRFKLFLNKIEIKVSFASKFISWIVWVGVFTVSIISVPDSNYDDLIYFTSSNEIIQRVLNFPSRSKSCFAVFKKVLPVMHKNELIFFERIVMVWWRKINAAFSRVFQ